MRFDGLCAAKLSECTDDMEVVMIEEVTTGKYQVKYQSPENIFQKEWHDVFLKAQLLRKDLLQLL